MYGGSLFERICNEFDEGMDEDEILYQSITNNLANILSTNTGNAQTVPDYGKVDLNNMDLNPKHSQRYIEESLVSSILLYEKRLQNPSVTVMNDQYNVSTMSIFVDGVVSIRGRQYKVTFKAKIFGDGRIKVVK